MPVAAALSSSGRCVTASNCRQQPTQQQPTARRAAWLRPAALQQSVAAGVAAAAVLLAPAPLAALADVAAAPPPPPSSSSTLTLSFVDQSVKAKLEERDEAMSYKCVQMFDCDGNRRDYAKKQWADFLARDGRPARKALAEEEAAAAVASAPLE